MQSCDLKDIFCLLWSRPPGPAAASRSMMMI
nr:MAG TPA: hypothetical protein [Bacteriophage sp.]